MKDTNSFLYGIETWTKLHWNLNSTKFNSIIGLRFNWKKMGCKLVENIFKFFLWMECWKKKLLKKFKKTLLYASSFGNGLNKFLVGIVQCTVTYET
jgi:hypothetical protein